MPELPPEAVIENLIQWVRETTDGNGVFKHFEMGKEDHAVFTCRVCNDTLNQATTFYNGKEMVIPGDLKKWATKHAHQPPAIEDVLATVFEPGNFKKKAKAKSEPAKPPEPKPLPVLVQHKGRKFRE